MTTFVSLTFIPAQLKGETETVSSPVAVTKPVESPDAKALRNRLNEIKAMDKSKLTSFEKKVLRKEVRSIKKQLREDSKFIEGVHMTFGTILIIFWVNSLFHYD